MNKPSQSTTLEWLLNCSLYSATKAVYLGGHMLKWASALFLLTLLAAVFAFTGVAVVSAILAKILFFLFLVIFLATLAMSVMRRA